MTNKNLVFTIPIPEEMYDSTLDAFARGTGWVEGSANTKLEHSRLWLNRTINEVISAYNANAAAEAARVATLSQVGAALDAITTTLVVE